MTDDANDSRQRVELAQERERINDFFASVTLDIKESADSGSSDTTYKVSTHNLPYVPQVVEGLADRGYSVEFDEEKNVLNVDWKKDD